MKLIKALGLRDREINYRLYFKRLFNKTIDRKLRRGDEDEYVFIVMARVYEKYGQYLLKHLRSLYPSCKLVLYIVDLLCNMSFSLDEVRPQFDVICSFDKGEAENNDMRFLLEPFSTKRLDEIHISDEPQLDVSFVGASKGRYDRIMHLFDDLTAKGLKCDFYIAGIDEKDQKSAEGLHYSWLSFERVLEHAASSRCIVEIMQPGGYSATTRYAEAMLLGKKLITDCPALRHSGQKRIICLDENVDITPEMIRAKETADIDRYVGELSIETFVNTIAAYL